MKKLSLLFFLLLFTTVIFAQPANDNCTGATPVNANGACYPGTTVGANDSWTGTVGCQSGNNHPDVWYSFVATGTSLNINVTAGTLTGDIEFVLVASTGPCTGLTNAGSLCGPSPLTGTINGIQIGITYYYTISSSSSSQGTFTTCVNNTTPPPVPGQDCNTSATLCNANSFPQGTFTGVGVPENIMTNSCFGGNERQSKWYKFTVGCAGTLGFVINPTNSSDDYDWAIWNTSVSPCASTMPVPVACNWSGCPGATGLSANPAAEPNVSSCGGPPGPCGGGTYPKAFCNESSGNSNLLNVTAGTTYTILIDNYTANGNGFNFSFRGTATIGPNANFTVTPGTCGIYNFTKTCQTTNSTFLWQFGDGTTSTAQNPVHTYTTFGNFNVTLQVTDALGCVATFSQPVNIAATPLPTVTTPVTYCVGAVASPLTATGTNLLWYTVPIGGVGSSTAPTPSTAAPGTTSYYVSQTIAGCESQRVEIVVAVNPNLIPTFNAVAPICSGGILSPLPTTSLNGVSGTWSPALNNTTTTTYTFTPAAGQCATATSLSITVNPDVTSITNTTICNSQLPYSWNGQTYNSGGTYSVTLVSASGCDSVATLNLTATATLTSVTNLIICNTQLPYSWNGQTYNSGGTYSVTLVSASGCDSVATLDLTATAALTSVTNLPICNTQLPYTWNGQSYNSAGTYSVTLVSSSGCDSIATLNLTVNSASTSTTNTTICNTQLPYTWNGQSYNSGGTYSVTLVSSSGCDSIATLNLTVNSISTSTTNTTICNTQLPYTWNGQSYNSAGTYNIILVGASGCDSVATLNLAVNQAVTSTTNTTICNTQLPYTWNGQSYNSAGTYNAMLVSSSGCDSIATLNLTVNLISTSTTNTTICNTQLPYTWNGQSYNSAGTYSVTLVSSSGCDSIATLNLAVNLIATSTTNTTICNTQLPYTWNGQSYNSAGTYSVTLVSSSGCDSIATLNLAVKSASASTTDTTVCGNQLPYAWNGQSYASGGTYSVTLVNLSGCDSVATLNLAVNPVPLLQINDPAAVCAPATIDLSAPAITNGSAAGLTYSYWTDAAATIPLNNPNAVATAGTYYIKGQAATGCFTVKPVLVSIDQQLNGIRYPTVSAGMNMPAQLSARNPGAGYTYLWSPATALDLPSIKDPVFTNSTGLEYLITITSPAGCVVVDTLLVIITRDVPGLAPNLFVPKAWTPNGDGHNDYLFPITVNITELKYFRIYNRWGQKVFETNIIGNGWDGNYNNKPQPTEVYTWILEATGIDGKTIKRSGNAVLIR